MKNEPKNILVLGATGGTGRATVEVLLQQGHRVTAFARRALDITHPNLRIHQGDALLPTDVNNAVRGHDAVIVALGIQENPMMVRLRGAKQTSTSIRSQGTRNVLHAMDQHGVRRLVILSSYGVGDTRHRLRWSDRVLFSLLLRPQIQDTEVQEQLVRNADVDWVFAQPVHLSDENTGERCAFTSSQGDTRQMKVSRHQVAHFLANVATSTQHTHESVALSG